MGGSADTANLRPLNAGASAPKPQASAAPTSSAVGGSGLRIIKFFVALALIPFCVGISLGTHEYFLSTWTRLNLAAFGPSTVLRWFGGGVVAFAIFAILLWRPVVLYVFGHELVHALAAWMCLGKVTNLSASAKGGQVTTSKSNTFIRLAPYCVPLYALLAVGVFLALNAWWQPLTPYLHFLASALGFLYAFHVGFTLWSLRRDQPDLRPDGWLFSLVMIYIANVAVFVVLIGFLCNGSPRGSWDALRDASVLGWQKSLHIYQNLQSMAQQVVSL
jgi:hypothetical protein